MSTFNNRLLHGLFRYFGRCPTPTRLRWGRALGWLAYHLVRPRVHVARTNLRLCFPDLDPDTREAWVKRHFYLLAQSVVDRGVLWFGSRAHMEPMLQITGLEHLRTLQDQGKRVLMLAPHFIGLDASATRLTWFLPVSATLYTPQNNPDIDQLVRHGRGRFNTVHLISRRDGVRGLIRQLRQGVPVYYLPDMDFGCKGAAFLPFFGVPAATLLTTAQIARNQNAAVVPITSRLDNTTGVYHITVHPPLADFPGEDTLETATAKLNGLIESWVKADPAQYYWVHKRFKTRPEGEASVY